jgi:hypothetical protein
MAAEFPRELFRKLDFYVYLYVDPRNNEIFYVGKGTGNRAFHHLKETSDHEKVRRIRKIRREGHKPRIEILRFGLSEREAELVEAAAIDLLGVGNLCNAVRGLHAERCPVEEIIAIHAAKLVKIRHKVILIRINRLYHYGITAKELYEATRGIWKAGGRRKDRVEYAFAVYEGVVREVYRIDRWDPAGTAQMKTRDVSEKDLRGRWEFRGKVAAENVRRRYLMRSVRQYMAQGDQNPIRYVNV